MDQNTEFLNYIYQNSEMGITTINQLVKKVDDAAFGSQLRSQLQEYQNINTAASGQLSEGGHTAKGIPKVAEASAYMSIGMKTLTDHSPQHIADMMIQGSTMGIIDVTKNLKKYPDAATETKQLADQLLRTEQSNIEKLKSFL